MAYWLDRRGDLPAGAPTTNALVIGTSLYDYLPAKGAPADPDPLKFGLHDLETPACGSFSFARWLGDRYHNPSAPLATVDLYLSASPSEVAADAELAAVVDQVERPLTATIRTALRAWRDLAEGNPDGVAVLYLSGHGILRYSLTDSVVLLQDFAADDSVLDYAIDVGGVHAGMAGATKAGTQMYFVDACRIHPDALLVWRDVGDGLDLPQRVPEADPRAAPVYFSASPDRPAFGRPGNGTLFAQALLECLEGAAADDDPAGPTPFAVTTYSLAEELEPRVRALAEQHRERQDVTIGGQNRLKTFHRFAEPPTVPLRVELSPEAARAVATAELWKPDRSARVLDPLRFDPHPLEHPIPLGLYSMDVLVPPPFVAQRGRAFVADPAGTGCRFEVRVDG